MSPVDSADTLEGKKFRQNRSISHRFRDKCVYVFYAEIQDGHQKWQQNDFWEKSPVDSADTLPGGQKFQPNCCISHRFPDKYAFTFYAEIQDGHQKWQENDFALSRTVWDIYTF